MKGLGGCPKILLHSKGNIFSDRSIPSYFPTCMQLSLIVAGNVVVVGHCRCTMH